MIKDFLIPCYYAEFKIKNGIRTIDFEIIDGKKIQDRLHLIKFFINAKKELVIQLTLIRYFTSLFLLKSTNASTPALRIISPANTAT